MHSTLDMHAVRIRKEHFVGKMTYCAVVFPREARNRHQIVVLQRMAGTVTVG